MSLEMDKKISVTTSPIMVLVYLENFELQKITIFDLVLFYILPC